MAGSSWSGLFVAPIMKTFFLAPMPSISVKIWLMTRSPAPPASPKLDPRALAIESNSSKNRTHGAACLALLKMFLTFASLSPNHCCYLQCTYIARLLVSCFCPRLKWKKTTKDTNHREQFRSLDRDEVGLTFTGNSLGKERLSAARRAIEENTLGRILAKEFKLLSKLDGVLRFNKMCA